MIFKQDKLKHDVEEDPEEDEHEENDPDE